MLKLRVIAMLVIGSVCGRVESYSNADDQQCVVELRVIVMLVTGTGSVKVESYSNAGHRHRQC